MMCTVYDYMLCIVMSPTKAFRYNKSTLDPLSL